MKAEVKGTVITDLSSVVVESGNTIAIREDIVELPNLAQIEELRNMTPEKVLEQLQAVTSYTGAAAEKIDTYLGQRMLLKGVFVHPCTVRKEEAEVNKISGELEEYTAAERTVLKCEVDGQEKVFGFVSLAAAGWVKTYIAPIWGMGDLPFDIPIRVRQTSTARGRSYTFAVVK